MEQHGMTCFDASLLARARVHAEMRGITLRQYLNYALEKLVHLDDRALEEEGSEPTWSAEANQVLGRS